MNGLICPQTVGMNLSVGAGEQEGLSSAEHYLSQVNILNAPERRLTSFSGRV